MSASLVTVQYYQPLLRNSVVTKQQGIVVVTTVLDHRVNRATRPPVRIGNTNDEGAEAGAHRPSVIEISNEINEINKIDTGIEANLTTTMKKADMTLKFPKTKIKLKKTKTKTEVKTTTAKMMLRVRNTKRNKRREETSRRAAKNNNKDTVMMTTMVNLMTTECYLKKTRNRIVSHR